MNNISPQFHVATENFIISLVYITHLPVNRFLNYFPLVLVKFLCIYPRFCFFFSPKTLQLHEYKCVCPIFWLFHLILHFILLPSHSQLSGVDISPISVWYVLRVYEGLLVFAVFGCVMLIMKLRIYYLCKHSFFSSCP